MSSASITSAYGEVRIFAGNGGTDYRLDVNPTRTGISPSAVASLPDGRTLIVDTRHHRVLVVSADDSQIDRFAGTDSKGNKIDDSGDPKKTQLSGPRDVAVYPDGRVLISDYGNHRVLVVNAEADQITVFAGTGEQGNNLGPDPKNTQLNFPEGLVVLPDDTVLIVDQSNHRVLSVDPNGSFIERFAGTGRAGSARGNERKQIELNLPSRVASFADGRVLITDLGNNRVFLVSADRSWTSIFAGSLQNNPELGSPPTETTLNAPWGVAVLPDERVLISDGNNRVLEISADQASTKLFAGTGDAGKFINPDDPTQTRLNKPTGIGVLSDGRIVICDIMNNRALAITIA